MVHKKVYLSGIKTLTLHADEVTSARRTSPIPQLTCIGKSCKIYQPDVVQCQNMGDDGTGGIQWRCDADLPNGMRFGKIHVSCEGWSKSGDKNILQGSCGLEYHLVRIDPNLERGEYTSGLGFGFGKSRIDKIFSWISFILIWGLVISIAYTLFRYFIRIIFPRMTPRPLSHWFPGSGPNGPGGPGNGGNGGSDNRPGFNGGRPGGAPPPPPYSKDPPTNSTQTPTAGWSPGFWTGMAAGGIGSYLLSGNNRNDNRNRQEQYENMRMRNTFGAPTTGAGYGGGQMGQMGQGGLQNDRGEGSSTGLRRATGFGGTSTR